MNPYTVVTLAIVLAVAYAQVQPGQYDPNTGWYNCQYPNPKDPAKAACDQKNADLAQQRGQQQQQTNDPNQQLPNQQQQQQQDPNQQQPQDTYDEDQQPQMPPLYTKKARAKAMKKLREKKKKAHKSE